MDKKRFKAFVGKKFYLCMDGAKIELKLIELREMPPRRVPGLRTGPFGLLFRGPSVSYHTEALPRQVHRAQAPDGEVFYQPKTLAQQKGQTADRQHEQAIRPLVEKISRHHVTVSRFPFPDPPQEPRDRSTGE
jgi:uncharacterized protein DUF6916